MESKAHVFPVIENPPERLPSLLRQIKTNGFDTVKEDEIFPPDVETESGRHRRNLSVSISMPSSPSTLKAQPQAGPDFENNVLDNGTTDIPQTNKAVKFLSQPMPKRSLYVEHESSRNSQNSPRVTPLRDERYTPFKTWSGKLERQLSNFRVRPRQSTEINEEAVRGRESNEALPVDRYFDALEGPELETLRASEEIVLPNETWPFLLRFPISSFGICLGVGSQAIMWKNLSNTRAEKFLHISSLVNQVLWWISVCLVVVIASTYLVKVILYFEAVRREYYHPIRVNFFFAPWIALLFLALGVPSTITTALPKWLWYVLMFPIFCLELKLYGQWMSGGQRRLSKVANPSNHLSIVGNFVGALLGAQMGLKEGPVFFFSVGMAHYIVLFVTLYQRLPTNETLPKELHPVFFLFVAAPSVASMAWANITGSFDYGSRIAYFIAMFLYFSLAVRVNFFRGFKFSLAWWAYTFPMTGAAIATIKYSAVATNVVTQALSVVLSVVATLTVTGLLVTTILHAFVLRNLFPNDIAIAISDRKPKQPGWLHHIRRGSSENVEQYLKFSDSSVKGEEAVGSPPRSDSA